MRNSRERATVVFMSILFLAIVFPITVNVEASPLQWSIETVDEAGNVGGYTSIALDSNNLPCMHATYVIMAEDNANNIITTENMGYEYNTR